MPEAPDPYGCAAYQQRIFKEATAAAHARTILRGTGFYLTNPITHNDRLVETAPAGGSAALGAGTRPASSRASATGSRSATRQSARREYEARVQQLEMHLVEERRTREGVEEKLAQLEALLAAKAPTKVVE
jgi:hypothetical protein